MDDRNIYLSLCHFLDHHAVSWLQRVVDECDGVCFDALSPRVHVPNHTVTSNLHELRRTGLYIQQQFSYEGI